MRLSRRNFIKTGLIYVPGASLAARAATTIIRGPGAIGAAAAIPPPPTPIINGNNGHSATGNKQTRPLAGASVNWGNPLTNGLAGCWLCNEGGGSTLYDLSIGRNMALSGDSNSPANWWGPGTASGFECSESGGLQFRNGGASATTAQSASTWKLDSTKVSVMVWHWFESSLAGMLVDKTPINQQWLMFGFSGDLYWRTGDGVSTSAINTPGPAAHQWHQYAGTYDGAGNGVLYVDGIVKGTSNAMLQFADTASMLEFGRTTDNFLAGNLGPVYIWKRPLSQQEVQELRAFPYAFISY